ncbi:hypothetical protein K661_00961 [Piscirickettsia salmonis LF-89 = ATCC VR-1361]|nr:hypothetical protein K661_00961 [Piscirickettsia salmonis LF-89 = ATCC VR-1361]
MMHYTRVNTQKIILLFSQLKMLNSSTDYYDQCSLFSYKY